MSSPSNQRTIVVLGDSIAAGYGLPSEYAWPRLLQTQLQQAYPHFQWHIHNLSVPGDTVADAYARFQEVPRLQPHLLIIALGVNDCRRTSSPVVERRIASFHRRERTWWGRSTMLRRLSYLINPLPPTDATPAPDEDTSQVGMEDFLSILAWMIQQAQVMNAFPALMTMAPFAPAKTQDPHFQPCPRYNTAIRDLARDAQIALIEVSHPFSPGAWQVDGVHLTPQGEMELAQRVFTNLRRPPIATHLGIPTRESNAHMAPSLD